MGLNDTQAWWALARYSLLLCGAAAGAVRWLLPMLLVRMTGAGLVAKNYAGQWLPAAAGIVPVLASSGVLLFWLGPAAPAPFAVVPARALLVAILGFAFVGLLDDTLGDRKAGGLGGHWARLRRGEMTTGALKALFGGFVAAAAAGPLSASAAAWGLHTFLIAAAANGVNLFDVRPGRGLKFAFAALGLLWVGAPGHPGWLVFAPALAAWAAVMPEDLGGRAMLGDSGANALGALVGLGAVLVGNPWMKGALALGLFGLHAATERGSISGFIDRHRWLRWLDMLGRDRR